MVKIVEPRLSVGGKTFNPFVPGALVTPTALGGLKIVTGSEEITRSRSRARGPGRRS